METKNALNIYFMQMQILMSLIFMERLLFIMVRISYSIMNGYCSFTNLALDISANHCKDCTTKANIEKILRSFGAKQYVNHLTELDEDELSLTSVKNWLSMWMFWVLHFFMCGSSHNPANQ